MMDLPSSDQAFSEGPALIPIVGNNTERGGESVLSNQMFSFFKFRSYMLLQLVKTAYIRKYVEGNPHI